MRTTIQSILTEPLMIAPAALPALLDEARADLHTNAPKREAPQVRCTLYGMDGMDGQPIKTDSQRPARSLVAIVGLTGTLTRHGYESWFSSSVGMLDIGRRLEQLANDESVYGIVLATHSPGGTVTGTFELADIVHGIRQSGSVKIVSVADAMMASAAMAIGSAAEQVYAIRSATLGSIGVVSAYSDYSQYLKKMGIETTYFRTPELKARFTSDEPLTPAMAETMQRSVEASYSEFVDVMARNRGVSSKHIARRFGGGETLTTREAIDAGMIDGQVASVDEVVASMLRNASTQGRRRR